MMYVRSRVETSKPNQALYNVTYAPGGPTVGTVIADTQGGFSYFNGEGMEVSVREGWRLAVEAWRKVNQGIWP